jgi:DNA-binding CsgD family transcriptional regulator
MQWVPISLPRVHKAGTAPSIEEVLFSGSRPEPNSHLRHALTCLTETLTAVGRPEFYRVLASALCPLFGCARYLGMRYGPDSKPAFLFNRSFSHLAAEVYLDTLYEDDPFYRMVRKRIPLSVATLHSENGRCGASRYRAALMQHAHISDELAIVLPIPGETSIAVCFNQADSCFGDGVVALAEAIYPVLKEANRLHIARVSQDETAAAKSVPLSEALKAPERQPRSEHFDRLCKSHHLSARERELLHLTVAGLANRHIAGELHLALGTVKNYKRRLYRKLGVHSERKLVHMVANLPPIEAGSLGGKGNNN